MHGIALLLDYVESQKISHANGYLWYSNTGAFQDITNIILGIDICLQPILQQILNVFKYHQMVENTQKYKIIINVVRNGVKDFSKYFKQKEIFLKIPCVNIDNFMSL